MVASRSFVVAGGGLAGLSSAIELASRGGQVILCEQSRSLGGRADTHHEQGFAMNIGPHGFYAAGAMRSQLDAWGVRYAGRRPLTEGSPGLIAGGHLHSFPGGGAALFSCGAFGIREKLRLAKVMSGLPGATASAGESMRGWIDRQAPEPAVRQMLEALTRLSTYAADFDILDAGFALRQIQIGLKASVLYLDDGWRTIIDGLELKARSMGVEIRTECGVTAVREGSVTLRGGEELPVDGAILAVPPRAVETLTGCALPAMTPARAACLDIGLRSVPAGARSFALGLDEAAYVSNHSLYARGLAPEGGALVQVACYMDRSRACAREQLEAMADLVMPGWRPAAVFTRFLPEMTVVHAIPQAGRGRPDVDTLKAMPSVMIAGDWVGPEGMLADAGVASGVRAARALTA